ncbi:MAG: leucine-rich repeat domain-containing protein, partial [Caulobacteraceae bacterium]
MSPAITLQALKRGELAGVRALDLGGTGLSEVPAEIYGLADTLEVLDLGRNALTRLPDDLGRLKRLRVLFCSGNRFERLPPVLGDCAALSQVGFRRAGVSEVPAEALPPRLRWLTLTDNAIARLPDALGERPELQKLMLAGNRLEALPRSLAGAPKLELLRLAANAFEALPPWLTEAPQLAWLAWAGNPLDRTAA